MLIKRSAIVGTALAVTAALALTLVLGAPVAVKPR